MTIARLMKWAAWYKQELEVAWYKAKAIVLMAKHVLCKPKGTEFTVRGKKCGRVQYLKYVLPIIWKS